MTTSTEHRAANRFPLRCPVVFDKGQGWSHDISPSGIYFSTQYAFRPSEVIRLVIHPFHKSPTICCDGQVVRTESEACGYGVAVNFTDFVFEAT